MHSKNRCSPLVSCCIPLWYSLAQSRKRAFYCFDLCVFQTYPISRCSHVTGQLRKLADHQKVALDELLTNALFVVAGGKKKDAEEPPTSASVLKMQTALKDRLQMHTVVEVRTQSHRLAFSAITVLRYGMTLLKYSKYMQIFARLS